MPLHPPWDLQRLMPQRPVIYALFDGTLLHIGESQNGQMRQQSNYYTKPWARYRYHHKLSHHYHDEDSRKHLEAFIIWRFSNFLKTPRGRALGVKLNNIHYTKTLGKFSNSAPHPARKAKSINNEILKFLHRASQYSKLPIPHT